MCESYDLHWGNEISIQNFVRNISKEENVWNMSLGERIGFNIYNGS